MRAELDTVSPVERVRVRRAGVFLALAGLGGDAIRALIDRHDRTRDGERVLKERFGTRVTRVALDPADPARAVVGADEVVVKEARVPPRRRAAQLLGWRSRVQRDFAQEWRLSLEEIATPRVLACTLRSGSAREFELTAYIDAGKTVRQLLWLDGGVLEGSPARLRLLGPLGRWIRRLHDCGVWQRDLKAHNVMVRRWDAEQPELFLLDIAAVRFFRVPLSRERRVRNLAQVLDVPAHLDAELAEPLLRSYLGAGGDVARWLPAIRAAVKARREERLRKDGFRFIDEQILSKN